MERKAVDLINQHVCQRHDLQAALCVNVFDGAGIVCTGRCVYMYVCKYGFSHMLVNEFDSRQLRVCMCFGRGVFFHLDAIVSVCIQQTVR